MTEKKPPATLQDVAREAGVSVATASRVINGSARRVADSHRTIVLAAAERIGYSANLSAQAIARGSSRIAAVLLSDIADPYFAAIASGVASATAREDLLVTMAVTHRKEQRELELLRELRGLRPRFVILAGSRKAEEPMRDQLVRELEAFEAAGASVVLIGSNRLPFPSVDYQNAEGAQALAMSLHGQGLRNFSVLAGPRNLLVAQERVKGFLSGLAICGLAVPDDRFIWGEFSREGGYEAMRRLLAATDRSPQTVFAVNDVMALGAMQAMREVGLQAPEPIAIAGFDDIFVAGDTSPPLTSVHVDLGGLGSHAVTLALAENRKSLCLGAQVVLRGSTGGR